MLRNIINRFSLFALAALLAFGCERADFRNGYSPGELEVLGDAKVYHLADGVMIEERRNGSKVYYLVESTVADYQLTLSPISKLTDLRFAVLLVRSAQPTRPLRHLLALKKLEFLHLASSCLKNKDELQQLVDDLPRLKRIEFNGGLTWPKKTA